MKNKIKELMNRALRKEEGFTLVEIIVVIVIMAILAAIAIPSVLSYINDANDAKYVSEGRSVYLACQVEEAMAAAGTDGLTMVRAGSATDGGTGEGETGTGIIEKAVIARINTTDFTVTDIDYDGTKYTISWTSGNVAVVADVNPNDEIVIVSTTAES